MDFGRITKPSTITDNKAVTIDVNYASDDNHSTIIGTCSNSNQRAMFIATLPEKLAVWKVIIHKLYKYDINVSTIEDRDTTQLCGTVDSSEDVGSVICGEYSSRVAVWRDNEEGATETCLNITDLDVFTSDFLSK